MNVIKMETHRIRVVIIQRIFSKYRLGIFDRLNNMYNLLILHSCDEVGVKQISTCYSKRIRKINYLKKSTAVYLFSLKDIFKFKPSVVIHEFTPSIISIFTVILFKWIFKYKVIIWGHGYNQNQPFNKGDVRYIIRKWLISKADAVLFYGSTNRNFIHRMFPSQKYFVANNALDTEYLYKINSQLDKIGKNNLKNELGVNNRFIIIFIGRLLREKILPEYFISIIDRLNSEIKDLGVVVIGDGPAKKELTKLIEESKVNNIRLIGDVFDDQLTSRFLYISDLLLMPGYVGLAVNNSFSFNTPVVSFKQGVNGPFHSPEIEYIKSMETGYLAEDYSIEDVCSFVIKYYNSEKLRHSMKKSIEACVNDTCSIESMESGFINAINYVLGDDE